MTLIRVTTPDHEIATRIAEQLVSRRLCASAHVSGPSETVYWWRDQLHHAREWSCELRTREASIAQVIELIEHLHPYEIPEILLSEVQPASIAYQRWLEQYTSKEEST